MEDGFLEGKRYLPLVRDRLCAYQPRTPSALRGATSARGQPPSQFECLSRALRELNRNEYRSKLRYLGEGLLQTVGIECFTRKQPNAWMAYCSSRLSTQPARPRSYVEHAAAVLQLYRRSLISQSDFRPLGSASFPGS